MMMMIIIVIIVYFGSHVNKLCKLQIRIGVANEITMTFPSWTLKALLEVLFGLWIIAVEPCCFRLRTGLQGAVPTGRSPEGSSVQQGYYSCH